MCVCVCVCVCLTGMEFRLRKRLRGSDAFIVTRDSSMDASRFAANYSASGAHAQWFSCWKIKADNHDIMK